MVNGQNINRREFFRKLFGKTIKVGIPLGLVASAIKGGYDALSYKSEDNQTDPAPVNKETPNDYTGLGVTFDKKVNDIDFKLYGVLHCKSFIEGNYNQLEQIVKDSSLVVAEAEPEDIESEYIYNDAKSYFGTLFEMCQKYNKKLVYMDNSSVGGHLLQGLATISGLSMGASGFSLIGQNIKDGELTRRKLISSGLIATIGTYIFMGGSIFAEPIKSLMYDNYIEQSKYEKIYTTHVTDHRDLTLANRLIKLTEILDKKEFETGKHVSFIFGGQHAIGAAYYLDHPVFRKIKSAVYRCTYDFVDNDKMTIYTPTPYKTWKRKDYIL